MDRSNSCSLKKPRRVAALVLCGAIVAAAGCETIGQDISELGDIINPTTPREAAVKMFDQYDPDSRRQGTVLLSNSPFGGLDPYVRAYRDMVDNERDPIVKATAIRALGRHGAPDDAVRIIPHLAHDNVQVRWEAAKALQRLHNPAAIAELLRTLGKEDEHPDVRVAAAVALGQYPEDRVFQGLVGGLNARELAINTASAKSLTLLTGQSLGLEAADWLAWYNAQTPAAAFAGQQEYLYPTYWRKETWLEKLAFWQHRNFETPAPPAGLRPKSERSTYEDEENG